LIFVTSQCLAASFRADMVIFQEGNRTISKFFLQDNQYRMAVKEDGKPLTILVDRTAKKTRVIDPSRKTYQEFANTAIRSLMSNPFEGYQNLVKNYSSKSLGKEAVNGIDCEKQAVEMNGEVAMTAWVSPKLNFPIKLLYPLNDYMTELQRVKEGPLNKDLFTVPPNFVKQEEIKPKTVKPKKRAAITGKETFAAPIGRRIGPGGILSVTVNPQKHIEIELRNENQGESSAIIRTLKNNNPVTIKSMGDKTIEFKKLGDKKEISLEKLPNPDTIEVEVTKGIVYVTIEQESPMWEKEQSREAFLKDSALFGFLTRPKLKISCQLTGNSQDKSESKLKVTFFKDKYKTPVLSEEISLKNGKSRQWEFGADQNILSGEVDVQKGDVQFRLYQFLPKTATEQSKVKTASKKKYKPKIVTQFTVTHPYGTSKPVSPDKDLMVTVTGVSGAASGTIDLYSDRKKTNKIDALKFKLKKKQAKSFAVSGKKNVGWATVWVHKGSFKVKLDQSPNAKAAPTPKTKKTTKTKKSTDAVSGTAASTPKTNKGVAAASGGGKQTASSGTILNGEVPLYKGARVVKTKSYGANSTAELQVDATPQELVDFYKQAMSAKGWKASMAMVQGNMGILQLKKNGGQLVFKVEGQGDASSAKIVLINQ